MVTKLRKFAAIQPEGNGPSHLATEAADEIERLREWITDLSSAVSSMRRDNWSKDEKIEALARRCEYLRRFTALEDLP